MMWKKKSQKGFTVIEVLVVLVIVGVLAAIAIPRMIGSSDAAKRNICKSNMDLINRQIELYHAINGTWPNKLKDVTGSIDYFPDGPPECPFGKKYSINSDHRVKTSNHKH